MKRTVATTPEDDFFVLSNLPPSRAQKRVVLVVLAGILAIAFIVVGPLAGVKLARVPAFVPIYLTAMFLSDSFTATLLFAQFAISRSLANLIIASGYVFTAIVVIPYSLTFPGVFAPKGLIGDLQSTAWLFDVWHAGFSMFVIGYALSKDADPVKQIRRGMVPFAIALSVALSVVVVSTVVAVCMLFENYSPTIILDNFHFGPLFPYYVGGPVITASASALVLLWFRRRSLLDSWLMVVLCLYIIEMPISYYPDPERFSLGWYTARVIGFLDSSIILVVLLYEITTLYSRLHRATHAQRREREARLLAGDAVAATLAHEVKQPLSGMITSADAGLRFLSRSTPDLDEAKASFNQVLISGQRATAMIDNVRTIFRKEIRDRSLFDLNHLVEETLSLVRGDISKHGIRVEADLNDRLPVSANRIQLQQVLVNLITNATDSMATVDGSRILSVRSGILENGDASISIADTGKGIGPQEIGRIFSPLFTTKSDGMGMGLLISRSIVESHDGRLWVLPNLPRGAVFHFSVRSAQA